jgi:hypothetical protein
MPPQFEHPQSGDWKNFTLAGDHKSTSNLWDQMGFPKKMGRLAGLPISFNAGT